MASLDTKDLERQVKDMYRRVAEDPHGDFHFELGRAMAERLGYEPADLDRIPAEAIDSFAGVGCPIRLAGLAEGEHVLDLGSGSGMDSFVAALRVGPTGRVVGVDMTEAQREKAARLRDRAGLRQVEYVAGYIEEVPAASGSFDCVISNGVINLAPDKGRVFREVARLLRPGGRMSIADIVTDVPLPEGIVCNATLWAACIGGALQRDAYREAIESAGLRITELSDNTGYRFLSDNAQGATRKFGVKSICLLAVKA
jgi:ubiquinone/menaquinone biosynthesis C-methylase UbiE